MQAPEKSAASVKWVDAVTAVVIFVLGAVVIRESWRLGARWGEDGPQAGYFPFYIGLLLCLSSIANFIAAIRVKDGEPADQSFVGVQALKMVLAVLIPTIAYVGLIGYSGIYVASVLFIALFMKWLGKYRWTLTIAVSVAVPVAFFLLFEVWFKIPLPKGPLEAALGLN